MNKLKVGIYLRLSNEDREKNGNDSESIKNQRNLLLDYINNKDDLIFCGEYCDEDLSGAGTYRPQFERLIKDCESKKIDVVLCKSQSRFSRDMEIIERYINNKFKEWNVRFIGICDNADTNEAGNKKSRQINGLVNEWYLEDVSANIRGAFKSKMLAGEFISPFAPYGYNVDEFDNNKLVIDCDTAKIVKKIFNFYLLGYGYETIAKMLNDDRVPSPSFYKYLKGIKLNVVSNKRREDILWSGSAIKKLLKNEVYVGNLVQGKRTTISYKNKKIINKNKDEWIKRENTHEAIISFEEFNKVQGLIKKRTKIIKKNGMIHIFAGKVFCEECGFVMRKKSSSRHTYLVCSNKDCDNRCGIRYDDLEKLVIDKINYIVWKNFDKDFIDDRVNNFIDSESVRRQKEKNDYVLCIQNRLNKVKGFYRNLYEDKVNDVISDEAFNSLNKIYDEEIKALIVKLENTYDVKVIEKKNILDVVTKCFSSLNKIIVDEFINKIIIGKVGSRQRNIKLFWKMSD